MFSKLLLSSAVVRHCFSFRHIFCPKIRTHIGLGSNVVGPLPKQDLGTFHSKVMKNVKEVY